MSYENAPEHTNDKFDVPGRFVSTDSNVTYGIAVVGQAQAGKSELARTLTRAWDELYPSTQSYHFNSGIGFRYMTADIMRCGFTAYDYDKKVDKLQFLRDMDRFKEDVETKDMERIVAGVYDRPSWYWLATSSNSGAVGNTLGSVAVTSAVPYVSEDPYFRPRLNVAAGHHLGNILQMPGQADLSERPSFVVLDGRNRFECNEILSIAGVALLGTFVVTCPEEVIATRKAATNPELDIEQETQRLRRRNIDDRGRGLGPMTLPQDIEMPFNADMLLDFPGEQAWRLAYAGNASRQNPENSGVIFRTDKMTLDDELRVAKGILKGMFPGMYQSTNK